VGTLGIAWLAPCTRVVTHVFGNWILAGELVFVDVATVGGVSLLAVLPAAQKWVNDGKQFLRLFEKLMNIKKPIVLVKIGGSLITDKTKPFSLKKKALTIIAQEVKASLASGTQLVVGHGAGSFAHVPAKKYGTKDGFTDGSGLYGAAEVADTAAQLNRIVVAALLKAGVPAFTISPSAIMGAENQELSWLDTRSVEHTLMQGFLPVLYGDVVLDSGQGATIFSTERVLGYMGLALKEKGYQVKQVIHCGQTNGVYDAQGQTIELITPKTIKKHLRTLTGSHGADVTGGMIHKVEETLNLAEQGIPGLIIDGIEHGSLSAAIRGEPVVGTRVEAASEGRDTTITSSSIELKRDELPQHVAIIMDPPSYKALERREAAVVSDGTKLTRDPLPRHVAIIMDGNRRWARSQGKNVLQGHKKVVDERVEELIEHAATLGIPYMTFWAFSTENWGRDRQEVQGIMRLFRWALTKKARKLIEKGARVKLIGNLGAFPEDIQAGFTQLMEQSKDNTRITVTFALNYGGRDEIVRGVRKMIDRGILRLSDGSHAVRSAQDDKAALKSLAALSTEDVQKRLEDCLDTDGLPDPDLIIRTSGEQRLSGFMPWQSVYAELYFPQVYMPDFGAEEFDRAMAEYQMRERRFGKS
jgi:undecaprenyl diphosphate synthase